MVIVLGVVKPRWLNLFGIGKMLVAAIIPRTLVRLESLEIAHLLSPV